MTGRVVHEAIILHRRGTRVSLLGSKKGRCDAFLYQVSRSQIAPQGTLISYREFSKRSGVFVIQNPILEEIPLVWAKQDIYLLHCLLELCHYFIPVGNEGTIIFSFLKNLYGEKSFSLNEKSRKILVCKLLSLLGVCPESKEFYPVFTYLSKLPVDNVVMTDLELVNEDVLDEWISWCINEHPYGQWFKAVPFFLKAKTDE